LLEAEEEGCNQSLNDKNFENHGPIGKFPLIYYPSNIIQFDPRKFTLEP